MDTSSLAQAVKGDVITPDHPDYTESLKRWAKNAERKAAVVVFVKDEADVAASIKFAKDHKLPFAIRGGGHNAAGASSAEGGLVVDLGRYMRNVRIDTDAKLAYVGGGCIWRDVDEAAIKYDLATVGGTVNHTGVGGLTLGGGYGWLSGRYGLSTDNLRQATVVTADGSTLTANDQENPDLFWGIRGGGCNFGVITEFVLQLYPQRKIVYAGPIVYTADKVEKVLNTIESWWPSVKEDEAIIQALTVQNGTPVLVLIVFFNGTEKEGRENFKAFHDIEHIVDGTKEIPYETLNSIQNHMAEPGLCYYLKGTAQKDVNVSSAVAALEKLVSVDKQGIAPALLTEYLPLDKINSVPSSTTAFRRERTPNVLINLSWQPKDGEADRTQEAREIAQELDQIVTHGQTIPNSAKLGYTNYDMDATGDKDAPAFDEKARKGFADNYPRLQKIKKEYDPEVFFSRWFPIAPANA